MSLIAALENGLAERRAAGLWRERRIVDSAAAVRLTVDGREVVAFASNDYLGLAADPALAAAVVDALAGCGVGAGASHLISGHHRQHDALERELAAFVAPCADARAVTFSTGYLANLAILTTLADREAAIFGDRLNHACLNDGALLSRAEFRRYRHGDVDQLARELEQSTARTKVIATDAVFSMDGDLAPLPALLALAERHDAWLVVDDAHGFGVLGDAGRGSLAHFGLASERIVLMGTLGKAAGVAGAFVAGHPAVVETLIQTARPYVFTTAAPPLLAAALRRALVAIRDEPQRRLRLRANIERFRSGCGGLPWQLMDSPTAIQPLVVGGNDEVVALSRRLWERGYWAPAIRPPTVPAGTARLRVTLSAAHAPADVDGLTAALAECARELR
jgi:8-amino-7-oxononanoate synthase